MDKKEAKTILDKKLKELQSHSWDEFQSWIACKKVEVYEEEGQSGAKYQIEIEAMWDDKPDDWIRVIAGIDDGGLVSSFSPITSDFLIAKDGSMETE